MKDEVKRILKMIEEGKITSEEGFKLLNALEEVSFTQPRGKFLKIYIRDEEDVINITLPVNLLKFITNFLPAKAKMTLQENEVDLREILNAIQEGANGTIVEIQGEDGEVIKISVE
ncbi:MAG: SHOCT-like domain-containing protein [Candidatus Hydrothermia bacterium]